MLAPLYTACPTTSVKRRFIDGGRGAVPQNAARSGRGADFTALWAIGAPGHGAHHVVREGHRSHWRLAGARRPSLDRTGRHGRSHRGPCHDQIAAGVRGHTALNAALFWYGVDRVVRQMPEVDPLRLWRWQSLNRAYWSITAVDRSWLMAAAEGRDIVHRRVAFSALLDLADGDADPVAARGALVGRFGDDPALAADLDARLNPPPPDAEWQAHETRRVARQDAEAFNKRRVDEDWKQFRARMVAAPTPTRRRGRLQAVAGPSRIWSP